MASPLDNYCPVKFFFFFFYSFFTLFCSHKEKNFSVDVLLNRFVVFILPPPSFYPPSSFRPLICPSFLEWKIYTEALNFPYLPLAKLSKVLLLFPVISPDFHNICLLCLLIISTICLWDYLRLPRFVVDYYLNHDFVFFFFLVFCFFFFFFLQIDVERFALVLLLSFLSLSFR